MGLLLQEHNTVACLALTLSGQNGHVMQFEIKSIAFTAVITPHMHEQIELLITVRKIIMAHSSHID